MKKKIERDVEDILNNWDPLGVNDNPEAKSEYSGYALQIVGMLYKGYDEEQIAEYLNTLLKEEFGLSPKNDFARVIAKKLISLELERPYRK